MFVYVDESGDEGTCGKGSRWLVFACIVDRSRGTELTDIVQLAADKIRRRQKKSRLPHFQDLPHRDKKGVLDLYDQGPWDAIVVASDTSQIWTGSALGKPSYQYNYALRYVVERASQCAGHAQEDLTLVLEARRNFNLDEFRRYMRKLRDRNDQRINWDVVSEERIVTAVPLDAPVLCVADGVAHAVFKALEPDREWGDHELAYAERIRRHLWRGAGAPGLLGNGITFMPTTMTGGFVRQYPWVLRWAQEPLG